jgi:hypothetical protein
MLETAYFKVWIENGIAFSSFTPGLEMNLEVAKDSVQKRVEYFEGKSYPLVVNFSGLKGITKEAREYLAVEGVQLVTSGAFIVVSPLAKVLGNLFLMLNKPKVPTRLFNEKDAAVKWIEQFKV